MLLAVFVAPSAAADTAEDCAILRKASGEYAKLAVDLANLRKTADAQEQADDIAALTATQRKIVDLARTIGGKLHALQVQMKNPALEYAYKTDAASFNTYADTLEGAINNGDVAATNIHVTRAYSRNRETVEATNDTYHEQCGK